jgi:glutaredoxin
MMKFFRTENCPGCQDIEDQLNELCLACEVIIVKEKNDIPPYVRSGTKLPFLIDDDVLIQGYKNIIEHLNELEEFKSQWYKFQSDACYCDDAGNIE